MVMQIWLNIRQKFVKGITAIAGPQFPRGGGA